MLKQNSPRFVLGMDVGYGNLKAVWAGGDLIYPARIKWEGTEKASDQYKLDHSATSLDEVRVRVDGTHYLVGPDTHLHVAEPLIADDYSCLPEYRAQVIGALHYVFRKTGVIRRTIGSLVLGLPVSNFAFRRAGLREAYEGKPLSVPVPPALQSTYGREVDVMVEAVEVVPQPVGSLLSWAKSTGSSSHIASDRFNLVIDPGARTFDWYSARGTKPIYDQSDALPGGMSSIILALSGTMTKELGIQVDYTTADLALQRDSLTLVGLGEVDMRPFHEKARRLASEVVDQFMKRLRPGNYDNVVLTGGALTLFEEAIRQRFAENIIRTVPNALMANANGFYLWGAQKSTSSPT